MIPISHFVDYKISRWVNAGFKLQASSLRLINDINSLAACGRQSVAIYSGEVIKNKIDSR